MLIPMGLHGASKGGGEDGGPERGGRYEVVPVVHLFSKGV